MAVLDTQHKRKSAVITGVILILLLFGIFNYGMKYLDPPIEYGLAINFGNSDLGSGEPVENTKAQATQQQEEVVEEQVKETPKEVVEEEVITNETSDDVPVIEKSKEKKEEVKEVPKEEKPKEKPKPKPSKETTDALNSLLNGTSKNGTTTDEGDDNVAGTKETKMEIPTPINTMVIQEVGQEEIII